MWNARECGMRENVNDGEIIVDAKRVFVHPTMAFKLSLITK